MRERKLVTSASAQSIPSPEPQPAMQAKALVKSLRKISHALDGLTDNWFLSSGSCLGYLRAGATIPWDTDVDIGIYDASLDLRQIARHLPGVERYWGIEAAITVATFHLGVTVDVFQFFEYKGQVAETVHHLDRNEVKLLLYPKFIFEAGVRRGRFCGVECNVLKHAHDYCRILYGDSYMVPDPEYDWWGGPRNAAIAETHKMFSRDARSVPSRLVAPLRRLAYRFKQGLLHLVPG